MRNIKIIIEYDGTDFHGWQIQPAQKTIQGCLIKAVSKMVCKETKVIGASRTDSGVHAKGQVANFFTDSTIPINGFLRGLNTLTPYDISILDVSEVNEKFHSRFSAKQKKYIYTVLNKKTPSALMRRFSWHIDVELSLEKMQKAANMLIGEMDYASFRASDCASKTTVRTISSFDVKKVENNLIEFKVIGRGFLKFMVRNMVNSIIYTGLGRYSLSDFKSVIEAKNRNKAAPTAPAAGLCLVKVYY